jgi:hypothetical protein
MHLTYKRRDRHGSGKGLPVRVLKLLAGIDGGMVYASQEFGRLKCSPGGDLAAKDTDFFDKIDHGSPFWCY